MWFFRKNCISSPRSETKIIKGRRQAVGEAYGRALAARHSFYSITGDELAKSYRPFVEPLKATVKLGGSSRIITSIDHPATIGAVRDLISAGADIRHVKASELRRCVIYDDMVAYFSIIEATITRAAIQSADETEGEDLWIGSTESSVIQSAKKRFFMDWENAIHAEDRINELEKGEPVETTRVIKENKEAIEIYRSLAGNVKSEALYLLPTARALLRVKKIGIIDSLISAAKDRGAKIRILCPVSSENIKDVEELERASPDLVFQEHESVASTILIVNREQMFTSELRNDDTYEIDQALSFSVYSNSKPTLDSHIALFESLWKQKAVYSELERTNTDLALANQELKTKDRLQVEFINIAAHELRTPIQPILGLSSMLESRATADGSDKEEIVLSKEELDIIVRNANRLERLAADILQVARIESGKLTVTKAPVELNKIITLILKDVESRIDKTQVRLDFEAKQGNISIKADAEKLTQVIYNLVDNAIKFTKKGTVAMTLASTADSVTVSVTDSGTGIEPQILPRLFTKFATKSERGTGLGLFIAKSIIEAHGGRIWAENNATGQGAKFTFTLPL